MKASDRKLRNEGVFEAVHRAFAEFLSIPSLIIIGFLLLVVLAAILDRTELAVLVPVRALMQKHVFGDAQATSALLGTIAGSIITVTSITFSLLLLAVQQAAAALTHQVYDQFLRRRINQTYFGFFVGLALYTLLILASVAPPYNPIFGASFALLLTLVALLLMIVLLYTTINQMRPVVVIEAIHFHTLKARECQQPFLLKTRASSRNRNGARAFVRAKLTGYLVSFDTNALSAVLKARDDIEVVLRIAIGAYVAFGDTIAEIRAPSGADVAGVVEAVNAAIRLEQQRDLDTDPAYGIEQLAIIGWTSVSTAKSNPSPGVMVVRSLRDLLARWSSGETDKMPSEPDDGKLALVYSDNVMAQLLDAFESLIVVASESMQHQTLAEIIRAMAMMFGSLPEREQARAEDLILRTLSSLGDHVLTADLNTALSGLVGALQAADRHALAAKVQAARETLAVSVGTLSSRATRVPEAN